LLSIEEVNMARVAALTDREIPAGSRAEFDRQNAAHGRVTNMKRTLARSPLAFDALMTWYPLHDAVSGFLGQRATLIFAHAISDQADCLICSTFFRRILIDSGEKPEALVLSEREETLVAFGRQLARDSNAVDDALYQRLAAFLTPEQIVTLTGFGAIMIATNVFNNALVVDLDEYLLAYRKHSPAQGAPHGQKA